MATMPEELPTIASQRTFWPQPPTPGLLVHSDRGGQYGGEAYRKLPHDHQPLRSQSRRGDYYADAQAESLWSRLKIEVLTGRERLVCTDLADAQASVADYFDYFNPERLHASIWLWLLERAAGRRSGNELNARGFTAPHAGTFNQKQVQRLHKRSPIAV